MNKRPNKFFIIRIIIIVTSMLYAHLGLAVMPKQSCNSICLTHKLAAGARCTSVNGNKIYYRSLGEGKPVMIFSSGTGFPADGWFQSDIANKISKKAQVFVYDRLFTFNSCPNTNNFMPLTAQDVVNQLRQLLKQENINPPYILVGQSIGGLYMLLYAKEFPDEVAGLVLMDATSDAGPTPFTPQAKDFLKKLGNPQNPTPENPLYNEMIGQLPSYLQIRSAPPLAKNIPLIVLYATKHCLPIAWTKKLMCMTPSEEAEHKKQQIDIYNMSNNHKLIVVDGDHMSFFNKDKNDIVLNALDLILKMSKSRTNN